MSQPAKPVRLLVVGLNYAPEQVGIGPYTTGLCEMLAKWGHSVEAVVGEPYYPEWRRHPEKRVCGVRREENSVGVTRCRHYIPASPSGFRRVLHLASFSLSAAIPALRAACRHRPEAVFVVSPSLLSVPVAWLAARLASAKLWIHIQDFEVDAAAATGLMRGTGMLDAIARKLEAWLLSRGDCVSAISPQMVDRLEAKGVLPGRTYELRNWASKQFMPDPEGAERYRREWGLGTRKLALYSGNIANKQGIGIIVEAAKLLQTRRDIVFAICGEGPNRRELDKLCAGLGNIQLHPLQPAGRMGGLLALASVHLLPQIPGAADLVLPSKLTNMLLSGRPVVATAAPGTGLSEEVSGCGLITPPGDAQAFADAITRLADNEAEAGKLGQAARRRADERWQAEAILRRFEAQLCKIVLPCG